MSQVQRTIDGEQVRRDDKFRVLYGVAPDGSFIPAAMDAQGQLLVTGNGTPGTVPDSVPMVLAPTFNAVAGVDPNGNSQLANFDAQGRLLVSGPLPTNALTGISVMGADPTGQVDATAAFQAAANAVPPTGATVYVPAGVFLITGTVTFPNPTTFAGNGAGLASYDTSIGPGADVGRKPGGSTLITNRTTGNCLVFNAGGSQIRDIFVWNQSTTPPTSGNGVLFNNCTNTHVSRSRFCGFYINVHFLGGFQWTVTNCGFHYASYASVCVEDTQNPDAGDQSILGSVFAPMGHAYGDGLADAILYITGSGLKVTNCKFNDQWRNCLHMTWNDPVGSDLLLTGNSFEGQTDYAIKCERLAGSTTARFGNIVITGNQFAVSGYGIYLGNVVASATICGNHINTYFYDVDLDGATNVKLLPNSLGSQHPITVGVGTTGAEIFPQASLSGNPITIGDSTGGAGYKLYAFGGAAFNPNIAGLLYYATAGGTPSAATSAQVLTTVGIVPVANGGTGATSATGALTSLGAAASNDNRFPAGVNGLRFSNGTGSTDVAATGAQVASALSQSAVTLASAVSFSGPGVISGNTGITAGIINISSNNDRLVGSGNSGFTDLRTGQGFQVTNAGGGTVWWRVYSSGGAYVGSNPTDPGANNLAVQGTIVVPNLPTTDPHAAGTLWRNGNTVMISTG